MNAEGCILVVDDERGIREGCRKILTSEGYDVDTAEDGIQAAEKISSANGKYSTALVDLKMPGMGGMELIDHIQKCDPDILIIVITAYASIDTAVEATKRGAYGYIPKPFTPEELLLLIKNGLEKRALSIETRILREEREKRLLEVAFERSKSNTIINCMTDGVIVINNMRQIVLRNEAALRINPEWAYIALPASLDTFKCGELSRLIAELKDNSPDRMIVSKELNIKDSHYLVNASPVRETVGEIMGYVVVFRDITAIKKLEKAKSMFVSMVGHEIKNPLAAIEGYLTVILEGFIEDDPQKEHDMLHKSLLRAQSLRLMVSDLMNLTAIETGNFVLKKTPASISDIIAEALESCREKADIKNIRLLYTPVGSVEGQKVFGDRNALVSVLSNVIDNAVKYTPDNGNVIVRSEHDGVYASVSVQDDGIGMEKPEIRNIFDEFYRVRNEHTAHIPGTGLGLSLVKRVTEMHNGKISVISTPGKGSVFTLSFPVISENT